MERRGTLSRREFLKLSWQASLSLVIAGILSRCTRPWKGPPIINPEDISAGVTPELKKTWMDIELPSPELIINLGEDTNSTVYYLDSTKYGNLPTDTKESLILDWLSRYFSDAGDGSPKLLDDLIRNISGFFTASMSSKDAKKLYEKGIRILAANVAGKNFFFLATPKEGVFGYDQIMAIEVPVGELLEENFSFASPKSDESIMADLLAGLVNNIKIGHPDKNVAFAVPPVYREEVSANFSRDSKPGGAFDELINNHEEVASEGGAPLYLPELITAQKVITGGEDDLEKYLASEILVAGTEVKIRKFACRKDEKGKLRFYALVSMNADKNAAPNAKLGKRMLENHFDGYRWVPVDSLVVYRYSSMFESDDLYQQFIRVTKKVIEAVVEATV